MEKEKSNFKTTNLKMGEKLSKCASFYSKKTHNNSKLLKINNIENGFSNSFEVNNISLGVSSDGIGTKIELAERMSDFSTLGFDLLAMVCDDLISNGYDPILISNVLDVNKLNENIINELFSGLHKAAEYSSVVISGGEIAELGKRVSGYGEFNINWSATGIGKLFSGLQKPLSKEKVKKGDNIFLLKSKGFRSNGFTLAKSILNKAYGSNWHIKKFENRTWGEILLRPSLIYTPFIRILFNNNIKIKAIAHITGGGVFKNLNRIIPEGLFYSKLSFFEIPRAMQELIKISNISMELAYETWNMGQGMIIIAKVEDELHLKCLKEEYIIKKAGIII